MRLVAAFVIAGIAAVPSAHAQFTPPAAAKPDGATLFLRQCGTCHVARAQAEPRQGPNLWGVVGRKAGSFPGFNYNGAFATSNIVWDGETLDRYLTNPQATVPGSVMGYRQANPEIRQTIIDWLKDQH
jgi:cytochrome c